MKNQLFLLLLTAVSLFASAQKIDLEQLKTKAKNGDKQAQYNMGVYYSQSGDYKQAVKWYKKSAEQNYAFAQHNLGYCYEHGEGVPQDYEKAAEWYKKAAVKGDPNAQNNLGVLYEEGLDGDTLDRAIAALASADLLIIAGTSLNVYPAAGLVRYYRGKHIVLINRDPTPMDGQADLVLHEKVGEGLSGITVTPVNA